MYPTLKDLTVRTARPDHVSKTEVSAGLYHVTKRVEWYDEEPAISITFAVGKGGTPQRIGEPSALTLSLIDRIAELERQLAAAREAQA